MSLSLHRAVSVFVAVVAVFLLHGCGDKPSPHAYQVPQPPPQVIQAIPASAETDAIKEVVYGQEVTIVISLANAATDSQICMSVVGEDKANCPYWWVFTYTPYNSIPEGADTTSRCFKWKVHVPETGKAYRIHWRLFPSKGAFVYPIPGRDSVDENHPLAVGFSEPFLVKKPTLSVNIQ